MTVLTEPKKSYLFRFCIENFPDSPILGDEDEDEEFSSDEENDEEEKDSRSQQNLQVKAWIQTYTSSRKIEDRFLIVSTKDKKTKDTLRTWKSCVKIFKSEILSHCGVDEKSKISCSTTKKQVDALRRALSASRSRRDMNRNLMSRFDGPVILSTDVDDLDDVGMPCLFRSEPTFIGHKVSTHETR